MVTVLTLPFRWRISKATGWPCSALTWLRMSSGRVTRWPLTESTLSPAWRPAAYAGLGGLVMMPAILPGSELSWVMKMPLITTAATRKLTAGPPRRIRIRWYAGFMWNPFGSL